MGIGNRLRHLVPYIKAVGKSTRRGFTLKKGHLLYQAHPMLEAHKEYNCTRIRDFKGGKGRAQGRKRKGFLSR